MPISSSSSPATDLANEQVKQAIMAQHERLINDAILHLRDAQINLHEAIATISKEEEKKLRLFRHSLTLLEHQVSQGIVTLEHQPGSTSSLLQTTARKPIIQLVPNYVELINSVFVDTSPSVEWVDIAGFEKAKASLEYSVILPIRLKDLYTVDRILPPKGLIFCGPPGGGTTMLARAAAAESLATFFCIPASSLIWMGDAENIVQTLFEVAVSRQPSVIFIEDIDSIISARTSNEDDASRGLKAELLAQIDAVSSHSNDVFVIGATNNPEELDDALPWEKVNVEPETVLVRDTEGYSGWNLQPLCEKVAKMLWG